MDNRELVDYGRKYVRGVHEGLEGQGLKPAKPLSMLLGDFESLFDRLEAQEQQIKDAKNFVKGLQEACDSLRAERDEARNDAARLREVVKTYADRENWYDDSVEGDVWYIAGERGWEPAQRALEGKRG